MTSPCLRGLDARLTYFVRAISKLFPRCHTPSTASACAKTTGNTPSTAPPDDPMPNAINCEAQGQRAYQAKRETWRSACKSVPPSESERTHPLSPAVVEPELGQMNLPVNRLVVGLFAC
jgi:hypothetical protein